MAHRSATITAAASSSVVVRGGAATAAPTTSLQDTNDSSWGSMSRLSPAVVNESIAAELEIEQVKNDLLIARAIVQASAPPRRSGSRFDDDDDAEYLDDKKPAAAEKSKSRSPNEPNQSLYTKLRSGDIPDKYYNWNEQGASYREKIYKMQEAIEMRERMEEFCREKGIPALKWAGGDCRAPHPESDVTILGVQHFPPDDQDLHLLGTLASHGLAPPKNPRRGQYSMG